MARKGRNLERLVSAIERATNLEGNVRFASPKRLRDKDTGKPREHDVVLTFKQAHHDITLAIECRDRTRKIGTPEVEAFSSKCGRTGVDRGVLVSSVGFTKPALMKAQSFNIGCLSLEQASGFDWCLSRGLDVRRRKLLHVDIQAMTDGSPGPGATLYEDGVGVFGELQLRKLAKICMDALPMDDHAPAGERLKQRFVSPPPETFVGIRADGSRVNVAKLIVECTYEYEVSFTPFDFHQYWDAGAGKNLYSLASAPVDFGETKGKLMFVWKDGGAGQLVLVPEPPET